MLLEKDLSLINSKGISKQQIEQQIERFITGFPILNIDRPATLRDGIKVLTDKQLFEYIKIYNKSSRKLKRVKFIPASGAATRMFQHLYDVAKTYKGTEEDYLRFISDKSFGSVFYLVQNLRNFAFYDDLAQNISSNGTTLDEILKKHNYAELFKFLLETNGLNYGNLPKGLLKFHRGYQGSRTPVFEHLMEGIYYATSGKTVFLHFTVSPDHLELFKTHITELTPDIQKANKVKFNISYSLQKPSTDTIAVNSQNEPFRDKEGNLLFRPGGHGALIYNLNEIDADIIFIKNIDNVVQNRLIDDTIFYKKALAGMLLATRKTAGKLLKKLQKKPDWDIIEEAIEFLRKKMYIIPPDEFENWELEKRINYLKKRIDRPIRICGMVRNEGEPGGGPFWIKSEDGTMNLQIVEGSQINDDQKELLQKATHFNPVDLVCSTKDFHGNNYNLIDYIDHNSGFISAKSTNGTNIKALELPGLWNGAMAYWNTIFVEVPATTFNPVKTINDLLRTEHLFEKDLLQINDNQSIAID